MEDEENVNQRFYLNRAEFVALADAGGTMWFDNECGAGLGDILTTALNARRAEAKAGVQQEPTKPQRRVFDL